MVGRLSMTWRGSGPHPWMFPFEEEYAERVSASNYQPPEPLGRLHNPIPCSILMLSYIRCGALPLSASCRSWRSHHVF